MHFTMYVFIIIIIIIIIAIMRAGLAPPGGYGARILAGRQEQTASGAPSECFSLARVCVRACVCMMHVRTYAYSVGMYA